VIVAFDRRRIRHGRARWQRPTLQQVLGPGGLHRDVLCGGAAGRQQNRGNCIVSGPHRAQFPHAATPARIGNDAAVRHDQNGLVRRHVGHHNNLHRPRELPCHLLRPPRGQRTGVGLMQRGHGLHRQGPAKLAQIPFHRLRQVHVVRREADRQGWDNLRLPVL
jgi:hypothetical protein